MNRRTCTALAGAAACLLLAAVSCTDLTLEPKSTVTETNVFTDAASYRAFIARVYAGLAVTGQQGPHGQADISGIDEGFSQYLRLWWQMEELPTEEAIIAWNDGPLYELNTQMWGSSNTFLNAMYYRVYFQVMMANEFLRQTTDAKLDARGVVGQLRTDIHTYRAEARFLRALSYWHGIDLFGPIPLVTEDDPVNGPPPAQATRAQVYDFIVGELTAIQGELPAPGPETYGRATTMANQILLAHVYLNAEVYTGAAHWSEAQVAANAVITSGLYSLNPNYFYNFTADNNLSPEIVFAVPEDGLKTQTWGSTTFLVHAACGGSMSSSSFGVDYCWWGLRVKPQADSLFPVADGRRVFYDSGQTLAVANMFNFTDGYAEPKYSNLTSTGAAGSHPTHVDTDYPMFRLADALLIYAEAGLRGGGATQAEAEAAVNQLRVRAYGSTSGNVPAGTMTLDTVLAERGRELFWEGHRRTDLIRFGRFTGGTYIWSWKGGSPAGTSTDPFRDLYPLPANELVANPNLQQNPGY